MRFVRIAASGALVVGTTLFGATATATAASAAPALACGAHINADTTLQANVGPCSGNGLVVTTSGVHLNLNGHRVFGATVLGHSAVGGSFAGIRLQDVHGVTVDGGGSVGSFDAGVIVYHGGGNVVRGLQVGNNNDAQFVADHPVAGQFGDGIVVLGSSNNRVLGNYVHDNGPYSGISVLAATVQAPGPQQGSIVGPAPANNLIDGNNVTHNNVDDVCPSNGMGGQDPSGLCNPGAPVYSEDIGIRIEGPQASHTTVSHNTVTWNGRTGISPLNTFGMFSPPTANIPPNTDTVISHNNIQHDGIAATIYDNNPSIGPVEGDGIFNRCYKNSPQKGCPVRTVIDGNTIEHDTASGIDLQVAKGTTVENNVSLYNNRDYSQTFVSQHNASGPYDDGTDVNTNCADNTWLNNVLGTISQPCVEHHVAPFSVAALQTATAAQTAGLEPSIPLPRTGGRLPA